MQTGGALGFVGIGWDVLASVGTCWPVHERVAYIQPAQVGFGSYAASTSRSDLLVLVVARRRLSGFAIFSFEEICHLKKQIVSIEWR